MPVLPILAGSGVLLVNTPEATQMISEAKSGISIAISGTYGTDYLVENLYHDTARFPKCVIYIKGTTQFNFTKNAQNGIRQEHGGNNGTVLGVAANQPGSVIRYRVDQEQGRRAVFSDDAFPVLPEWSGAQSFSDLDYDGGSSAPVLGVTGAIPGHTSGEAVSVGDPYYWRGVADALGDEWHTIAVADDDRLITGQGSINYTLRVSDSREFVFVVDPTTPCVAFTAADADAQFYTTPPKAYWVPKIVDQTTYVVGNVFIVLSALDGAACEYSLVPHGNAPSYQAYDGPIATSGLTSNTVYDLKYRIGAGGTVKTRLLHVDPAYPSDAETHPGNILWDSSAQLDIIKAFCASTSPHKDVFGLLKNDWTHNGQGYVADYGQGYRSVQSSGAPASNAFVYLVDGLGAHVAAEQMVYLGCIESMLNLDPIGCEFNHNYFPTTKEFNYTGYQSCKEAMAVALAYDWTIKTLRAGGVGVTYGFTAVEDYFVRDRLASFAHANAVYRTRSEFVEPTSHYDTDMWRTSWTMAVGMIAAVMPEYDSPAYGTSGAPSGSQPAPHAWAPYPGQAISWWDQAFSTTATRTDTPDMAGKSGVYGCLNTTPEFTNRPGYWSLGQMAGMYYTTINLLKNYNAQSMAHVESALALAMAADAVPVVGGGWEHPTALTTTVPGDHNEGDAFDISVEVVNKFFPTIAPLAEGWIGVAPVPSAYNLSWPRGFYAICGYDPDWRSR